MEGEITSILDDSAVLLRPGGVVVQRDTNRAPARNPAMALFVVRALLSSWAPAEISSTPVISSAIIHRGLTWISLARNRNAALVDR